MFLNTYMNRLILVDLFLENVRLNQFNWFNNRSPSKSVDSVIHFIRTNWLSHQWTDFEKELNQFNQLRRNKEEMKWFKSINSVELIGTQVWLLQRVDHEMIRFEWVSAWIISWFDLIFSEAAWVISWMKTFLEKNVWVLSWINSILGEAVLSHDLKNVIYVECAPIQINLA